MDGRVRRLLDAAANSVTNHIAALGVHVVRRRADTRIPIPAMRINISVSCMGFYVCFLHYRTRVAYNFLLLPLLQV